MPSKHHKPKAGTINTIADLAEMKQYQPIPGHSRANVRKLLTINIANLTLI